MTDAAMTAEDRAAAEATLAEAGAWRRIMALGGERTLDVYLDIKSPHAYLAVRPSLMVARDYRVALNFQPVNLSYVTFGLSTRVDEDMQRRPPSPAADRKARMYYAAARQYAALQRLPLRSPHRLLDSENANKAFLFAKRQCVEVPFIMHVWVHGWGSGWRDYEVESSAALRGSLKAVGGSGDGFDEFLEPGGAGDEAVAACQAQAEASGLAGVPHFVFHDDALDRDVGLFGREHLALIRGKFHAAGLVRRPDVTPDFSHAWSGPVDAP